MLGNKKHKKRFDDHYNYEGKLLNDGVPFAVVEAYKKLRTNLIFSFAGQKIPVFAVTSHQAKAGKTITSANIAISFSLMGKKVLLVDADMRLPAIHKAFKYDALENGFSTMIATADHANLDSYVIESQYENLYILDSGTIPPNPSELLTLKNVGDFFDEAAKRFDVIIIDMPPVGDVTDAVLLAPYVTGYLIVVRSEVTKRGEIEDAVSFIEKNGGKIAGFILNGMNLKASRYGYGKGKRYGYSYEYGNSAEKKN